MLVVNVLGGLGNQMFQYAVGRALALRLNRPLKLDVSDFRNYRLHNGFELTRVFSDAMDLATREDMREVLGWQSAAVVRRILLRPRMAGLRNANFILEPHFHHWPGINAVPAKAYLIGYWQSEKYFKDFESDIRTRFTFRSPLSDSQKMLVDDIVNTNAVSVHVRRGDYVGSKKTNAVHGVCSIEYYKAAFQYFQERLVKPIFYIFSDDMEWVRGNISSVAEMRYVDGNLGLDSHCDMRLMSLCKHHIIANSSFSWWGAWLNPYPDKMVVAPKQWFANQHDTRDICPSEWVRY